MKWRHIRMIWQLLKSITGSQLRNRMPAFYEIPSFNAYIYFQNIQLYFF